MSDEFVIIDEKDLPLSTGQGRPGKWSRLADMLADLPIGKWIEVPLKTTELPGDVGLSISQSMRQFRKPFKVSYRTDRVGHRLFVTRRSENNSH